MGTWGTGPFSSDGALDLLDMLVTQPASQRRETLERILFRVIERPGLLGRQFFPDETVAAAAVVAASLPGGEGIRQDLADQGYDADAILVPAPDPELSHPALQALLVAPGEMASGTTAGPTRRTQPRRGKPLTGSPRSSGARSTRTTGSCRCSINPSDGYGT